MPSDKQLAANRRNAQKSTGPKSDSGKARSAMNALKSGLYAKSLVLPTEKAADLETLIAAYHDQFRPGTPELRDLVDEYVILVWQLRRLGLTEVQIYKHEQAHIDRYDPVAHPQGQIASNNYRAFESLQRRLDSTRRQRDRVRDSIRRLRAEQAEEAAQAARVATIEPAPTTQPTPTPPSPKHAPRPAPTPSPADSSPHIGFVPSPGVGQASQPVHPANDAEDPAQEPNQAA